MERVRPPGGGGDVASKGRSSMTRCSPGIGRPEGTFLKMRVLLVIFAVGWMSTRGDVGDVVR